MSHTISTFKKADRILWILVFIVISYIPSYAQTDLKPQELRGLILDLNSNEKLFGVQVKNLNTGEKTLTKKDGQFNISTRLNDQLEFRQYGYRTDTMVVIEFDYKRIYMSFNTETIRIDEVTIRGLSTQQLDLEIEKAAKEGEYLESSKERGGLRISLSRALGDKGKQARFRHAQLLQEKERRLIEKRFSIEAIQALTPLKDDDLEMFMVAYRPKQDFVLKATDEDFKLYIMDSYAAFKKLTPKQRKNLLLRTDNSKSD